MNLDNQHIGTSANWHIYFWRFAETKVGEFNNTNQTKGLITKPLGRLARTWDVCPMAWEVWQRQETKKPLESGFF